MIRYGWIFLLGGVYAADLEWKAEFRYRAESDKSETVVDSVFNSGRNSFHYTRSRISLRLNQGPVTGFAQLQDSRQLGAEDNLAGTTQPSGTKVEFHQIYFQIDNMLKKNWSMRFGRFEMPLGSERLFSKTNWNNVGRSFEGIHTNTSNLFGNLQMFYLINQDNSKTRPADIYDEYISGVYFSALLKRFTMIDWQMLDVYWYKYFHDNVDYDEFYIKKERETYGGQLTFKLFFLQFEGEFAFQSGYEKLNQLVYYIDSRMQIFNFHVDLTILPVIDKVSLGKEYYSGDDPKTDDYEGFANPWGAGHKYHGYFDNFTRFNYNFQDGLDEWNVKTVLSLPGDFKLNVHYHDFKDGVNSDPLGTELDVVISKKLSAGGVLQQGFARYWEDGGSQLDYSWLMLTFTL